MKSVLPTGRYKRDLKRIAKRGADMESLDAIVTLLQTDASLPIRAHPHKLSGEWDGYWKCHVEGDWLLIYDVTDDAVILARTGTHADLFE